MAYLTKVPNEPIERLRTAIVKQALQDYVYLVRHPNGTIDGWSRSRLENWFMSTEFAQLCDLNPKDLMRQCEVIARGRRKKV